MRNEILAIAVETSGRLGSVAIGRGDAVLASAEFSTQHNHGVELLPTVVRLSERVGIRAHEFRHVYVSGGPGSFTGLRIGISFAKAMALATGAQVVRVPTLDVVAQNALEIAPPPPRVAVVLDAKRGNVYCAGFRLEDGAYLALDEPAERDPASWLQEQVPVVVLGEGIAYHRPAIESVSGVQIGSERLNQPRAATVHRLGRALAATGRFIDRRELIPIYVRRPEAEEKWEQRHS